MELRRSRRLKGLEPEEYMNEETHEYLVVSHERGLACDLAIGLLGSVVAFFTLVLVMSAATHADTVSR
jgi:hypothetical protein